MSSPKISFKDEKELQETILQEKLKGTPDLEIGKKYGVTFRYIENLITKTHGINISVLKTPKRIKALEPKNFQEEQTTVWSFRQRGNWATHNGEYRGNWSPYIPRNLILRYSQPGEIVLDYFCGAGTTAVECKLLGRKCIALDINEKAIELAKKNLDFTLELPQLTLFDKGNHSGIYEPQVLVGDARDLSFLNDNSIDLICAHPPYANIIHYTNSMDKDLSFLDIDEFLNEMSKVAQESFRVLNPGGHCAILIGDTRRKKHIIPLGFKLINVYLSAGFKLRELIIKRQHNCKTTGFWYTNSIKYNFLLLAHEYLPIFEKPEISIPSRVNESVGDYGLGVPTLGKTAIKKRVDKLETTTVWIFPEKDFQKQLDTNVIGRYSNSRDYSTITFTSSSRNKINFIPKDKHKGKELLFIKSPFLNSNPSRIGVEQYLKEIKEIIIQELPSINNGGYVVIQTQDVRINGYIESLAKKCVDMLTLNNLWLKEIVIVTQEEQISNIISPNKYLNTIHQYLLVYEKISRDKYV